MSDETFIAQSNFIFESKSKEYKDMNLGIDRMSLAITAMGDPCKETPAIHMQEQMGKALLALLLIVSLA
tara:strand:- start:127 stop:333 length:207 start_codon:yes stop_codon:yes gene_type:complete